MTAPLAIWPDRAQYRPGQPVRLLVHAPGAAGSVRVTISERSRPLAELTAPLTPDGHASLTWTPPTDDPAWRAYGADAALADGTSASTAFDVAPHWRSAPRYGALADFRPGHTPEGDAEALNAMLRLHINVVQFYDWMYTHYDYIPPTEIFTDVLGRTVDFGTVRRLIRLCRERGMAPLAYGSVYGAETPFAEAHQDWLCYDGAGRPISLGNTFFIQDPSPGTGWRQYLMGAYRAALAEGFAGIHCDTYGMPRTALTRDDRLVRFDHILPGIVAEADALAREYDPAEGGSMLNNVKAWPLEAAAQAEGSALYVEPWPPDSTYRDLYEIILRARRADRFGRQAILAAYLHPFHPDRQPDAGAIAGLKLASATIFAAGGYHLLPTDGQAVLTEAYYPRFGRLTDAEFETVRAYWDFQTRYGPLLADPTAQDLSAVNTECRETEFTGPAGVRFSAKAEPGTVWTILKEGEGYRTVHLLNLTAVTDPCWNSAQPEARPLGPVTVRLECLRRPQAVWWAAPDESGGAPQRLDWQVVPHPASGTALVATLPRLQTWSMLVIEE